MGYLEHILISSSPESYRGFPTSLMFELRYDFDQFGYMMILKETNLLILLGSQELNKIVYNILNSCIVESKGFFIVTPRGARAARNQTEKV